VLVDRAQGQPTQVDHDRVAGRHLEVHGAFADQPRVAVDLGRQRAGDPKGVDRHRHQRPAVRLDERGRHVEAGVEHDRVQ
jgi:hypothetical protein